MTNLKLSQLIEDKPVKIEVNGQPVCVVKNGEKVFAVGDTCSHSEASLAEGEVRDGKIECWLHGAEFDLDTGEVVTGPAFEPIPTYKVVITGDDVKVGE